MDTLAAYLRHRDEIAGMLDERFYPIAWIDDRVASGAFDVFHDDKAVIAVEARKYPGGATELHGMFAAGELASIKSLVAEAVGFARHAGMTVATIESRPGWAAALKDMGFAFDSVRVFCELND